VGGTRFWTFNIADAGITIGAILLAISLWAEPEEEPAGTPVARSARAEPAARDPVAG
jgi:lipoprotein signal peptidase